VDKSISIILSPRNNKTAFLEHNSKREIFLSSAECKPRTFRSTAAPDIPKAKIKKSGLTPLKLMQETLFTLKENIAMETELVLDYEISL
jgi:hypothetical protein